MYNSANNCNIRVFLYCYLNKSKADLLVEIISTLFMALQNNLIELSIQNGASDAGIVVIAYINLNNVFFVKVNAINLIQFAL